MAAISPITLLFRAVDQATPAVRGLIGDLKKNFEVVTALSFAYNQVTQTIQQLAGQGQKAYQLLIGQNVELQNQLLSTQATLVATNKIIQNGVEVRDPGKAIQALTEPVSEAIAQIRRGSLELVGVTSDQLIPLFQITAQSSANIGASLSQSADLTLSFAAALGTLKIPLDQARQELNSIYTAQITSDSQLAKSLGLNNQMVNQWKAQGVLVARLTERLGAFRAGNAIQAATIDGVTSNLQELLNEIGRVAGEPLLQPIVQQLDLLYKFLNQNKDTIQQIAVDTVNFFLQIGTQIGEAVAVIAPALQELGGAVFTQLSNEVSAASKVILILVDGLTALLRASEPLIQVLADITKSFAAFTSTDLGNLVLQATLLTSLFSKFIPVLIAIQANFVRAATAAILFNNAALGNAAALTALRSFAPALAAIAASYASAGGGAVGFAAALGTATASMKAFAVAAGAAMAPLLPLIAIGGALTVALIVKQTGDLKNVNEELETFREQNDLLADESIRVATKLKALNDAERENGKLTEEQAKKRVGYQRIAAGQVDALKQQLEAVKGLQPANEDQKNAQAAQIAQLERMISLLQKQSGGVKLQARDLEVLGNAYQQLQKKIADAQAQFEQGGGGDSSRFQSAAKELVQLTQKQLELGQITEAQAIARLEKVRNDGRVEYEVQLSAQDAITKARQGEVDKRVNAAEVEQQKIQALISGEVISQSEGQRRISENRIKQLNIQLDAVKVAIVEENKLRQTQVDTQLAAIDKQIQEAEGRRQKAEGSGDKGGARLAKEDLTRLQTQRSSVTASLQINSDRLNQLKSQEQKFSSEIAQTQSQERQRVRQERLKDFDEQQQILDSQNARRLISQEEFNQKSLQLTKARGQAELQQLAEQRGKLSPTDKEGLEAIAAREAAIRKQIADATEKFEQQKSQSRIAAVDSEQKQLAAKLAEGAVSQEQFNQQSLQLTQRRLRAELDEVQRQRGPLKVGDKQRAAELDAQEADIRKRSVDALAQNQEQQVQLIEQAQKRATDIVSQSESDRLLEITQLEAEQTITKAGAEKLRTDAVGDRVKEELRLEKDKLAQLESLPPFSDPAKEEQRQGQIGATRLRTTQLTKSLIDNEVQQREAAFRVIEDGLNRQIQAINNAANAQNQALEKEQQLLDFTNKTIGNQISLLEARKNLVSSVAGFYEGELNVLKETTKNQREQKQLGETAAQIRLNSARAAFQIEKEITQQKLEQKEIEFAIRELQLQGEAATAKANTLKAQAEQKKVEERPGATQGEKDAAALDVQAAQAKETEVQIKGVLLGQERAIASTQGRQELAGLERNQQLQDDQNRLALANARRSRRQRRQDLGELREDVLRRGGVESARDFGQNINFKTLGGDLLTQIAQLRAGVLPTGNVPVSQFVGGGVNPAVPQATTTQALQALMSQKQPVGTVNITVNNEFANADNRAADTFTQRIRKELYDVGVLLTK